MIDPLSAGFVDLERAVARLATDISDQEVDEEQRRQKNDAATLGPAGLHWVKREMAIARLYAAFCCGSLITVVRDPVSGALFRLICTDWKQAAFWRDTIVGGIVRAQTCEEIAPHEGRRVLMEAGAFDAWLNAQMRRRSQPAKAACREWLEAAMREAPREGLSRSVSGAKTPTRNSTYRGVPSIKFGRPRCKVPERTGTATARRPSCGDNRITTRELIAPAI
jgi:hypothetical protein